MTASSSTSPRQRDDRLDTGRSTGGLRIEERVTSLRERLESRADGRAAAQLRSDVRAAREHVRDWNPSKAVSQNTASRYAREVQKMKSTGHRPEDAACKSTYEFRRAALVHETRSDLKAALTDLDRAKRKGDLDRAAKAYNRVRAGLETLRQYPPSTGSRECDLERTSAYRGPARPPEDRSNGKRQSLDGLPNDWKDRVQRETNDRDKPAVAVLALTGCRPEEVRGTRVRQDDEQVRFEIRGAKVDQDRGIKMRVVTLDRSELEQSQAGRDLLDWVGNRDCRTVTHEGSTAAFRERVARAADRAGLEQVTSYTFRHAEARELKQSGLEKSEIAARLGHRSERSQSVYG